MKFLLIIALAITPLLAQKNDKEQIALQQQQLETLRRETEALKRTRAEKLDKLEQLESLRWQERYRQNRLTQDYQDETRSLEGRYSKASSDLSRLNDELVQARSGTSELDEKAKEAKSGLDAFVVQVRQGVDRISSNLVSEIPVGLESRTLNLAKAKEALDAPAPRTEAALGILFDDLLTRHEQGLSQQFGPRNSQMGERTDVPVYRLSLGTVFMAELERDGAKQAQALLRTGALQGKVFEWRSDLSQDFSNSVRNAVLAAQQGNQKVWLSLDVLQNKSIQSSTAAGSQEKEWKQELVAFFKAGGVVMYPLMLVALMALLLAFERWQLYMRRGRLSESFIKNLHALVADSKFKEARDLCLQQQTAVGATLFAIVNHSGDSREAAEKALREAMLREQPRLEKRLGLVSALGSVAPLLGLLGTVTGMITLFKVITEVGTNDARVLAGGISEALVTTETGLIIAIPILLIHGNLSEKLDNIISQLNVQSLALLNRMWPDSGRKG